jgi:hypothetical protein
MAAPEERQMAVAPVLERVFTVGHRAVTLGVDHLRTDGTVAWSIRWFPVAPKRLPPDVIAAFDRGMAIARRELIAELGGCHAST